MEVRRHANPRSLALAAAELILDDCRQALARRSSFYTIGLSGGRTPVLLFQALTGLPMPWSQVHIFQVDERVAPADSEDRNLTRLSDCLLDHIDIPSANIHPMPVESDDLASACRCYEDELQRVTDGRALDMLQLGLGEDGHTASLAPADPILDVTDRAIWHVASFNGLARMSMTYPLINRARWRMWLALGLAKAEMCRRLVTSDHAIPAGRVASENAVSLVDDAAAVQL